MGDEGGDAAACQADSSASGRTGSKTSQETSRKVSWRDYGGEYELHNTLD